MTNPSGVLFGAGSQVNVHGLVATTLSISDQDFLNVVYNFKQDPNASLGSVVNEGDISASGFVALLAPGVVNEGTISANHGSIALGSGTAATLDFYGDGLIKFAITEATEGEVKDTAGDTLPDRIRNSGLLQANGGLVQLTAQSLGDVMRNIINQEGIIEANTIVNQGGRVFLDAGTSGDINVSGTISANGDDVGEAGGEVDITAQTVTLDSGVISATGNEAEGGLINITGPGAVSAGGLIDASGSSGGAIDIESGRFVLAEPIRAVGTTGAGGTVNIHNTGTAWQMSTGSIDVSGASGGTITHISDRQINSSADYYAVGFSGPGGKIDITAPALKLLSPTLNASGFSGGGRIRIGGEYQGGKNLENDELPNAALVTATDGTQLIADTTGKLRRWRNHHHLGG